jgi:NTP pyrophosphatase (non-canonical NTP hydrolase)
MAVYFSLYYIRNDLKGAINMKTMNTMQQEVDTYISQFKTGYFSPLANLARLTEEVGELSREINHLYGEKKKKDSEADNTIKAELGDNLFVLLCIANSLDIDMTESFNETLDKYNGRDKNRFE